ncbi:MAG: serine/threonine-protein kinase [Planctomycetota bacterium]
MDQNKCSPDCPDLDDLKSLLDGTLAIDSSVATRVDSCGSCQSKLEELLTPQTLGTYLQYVERTRSHLEEQITIAGFKSLREVGRGGMGIVFQAIDQTLTRTVAVKVLGSVNSFESNSRFERESRAAASISHPNVIPVHSTGHTDDGRPYLVMPFIEGTSLRERLRDGPLESSEAATIVHQISNGLEAAHSTGLIHRDVKSSNILLDQDDHQAKLADFGLVRTDSDHTLTMHDIVCGTPEYMSPEQASDPSLTDVRADIYSLGIVLYECLVGHTPFRGKPLQIIEQHRHSEPVSPSRMNASIARDLETICLKSIAKHPAKRYQSASQLAADLQRFLDRKPIQARRSSWLERVQKLCIRNPALATSIGFFVLSMAGGIAGTSTMWWQSAINAGKAQQYADTLEASRERLRDSVSRFQQRVISQEAAHWQMSPQFRQEMFGDVIEYLDEFASLENTRTIGAQTSHLLTRDYLAVAQAAADVGQPEQATLAAERALKRLRRQSAHARGDLDHWNLLLQATEVLFEYGLDPSGKQTRPPDALKRLANEAQNAAREIQRVASNDETCSLAQWQAEYMQRVTETEPSKTQFKSLYYQIWKTGQDFTNYQNRIEALELALKLSWYAWVKGLGSIEMLENNLQLIDSLRNNYRAVQKPLHVTDYYRGHNEKLLAEYCFETGDIAKGDFYADRGRARYLVALKGNPQNRNWRLELAELKLRIANELLKRGENELGEAKIVETLQAIMPVKELEPGNHQLNKQVIQLFIKMAEIRQRNGKHHEAATEFFIAAQDCMLYTVPQDADWTFDVLAWCYHKTVENLRLAKNPDRQFEQRFRQIANNLIENMKESPSIYFGKKGDVEKLTSILAGEFDPPKPHGLEIQLIR